MTRCDPAAVPGGARRESQHFGLRTGVLFEPDHFEEEGI